LSARAGLWLVALWAAACGAGSPGPSRLTSPASGAAHPTAEASPQGAGGQSTQEGPRRSGSLPASEYVLRPIRGFDVRVAPSLIDGEEDDVGARALDALDRDLGDVLDQTPAARHAFLRSVPIFLGVADPVAPCACYHPSASWLERNGFDPAKEQAVEITSARTYLDWRRHQASMVLHELAHALMHQEVWSERRRVEAALAAVRERGIYDRTLRWSGAEDRHYALNDLNEYFAETTEALYGVNDFYPFVRAELLEVDPLGAALVQSLWEERPSDPVGEGEGVEASEAIELLIAAVDAAEDGASRSRTTPSLERLLSAGFELVTADGSVLPKRAVLSQGWPAGAVQAGPAVEITSRELGTRHLTVRFEFSASGTTCSGVVERVRSVPGGLRWLSLQLSQGSNGE
jgi:hypothetical protein